MKRYEYTTITFDNIEDEWVLKFPDKTEIEIGDKDITELLNELGSDGWHIVGTGVTQTDFSDSFDHEIYLERELYD